MYCIILTAGKGTRMGNLTKDHQKTMLKIKNKPKLAYTLENLPEEITDIVFVVGYKKEEIINYFGKEYQGLKIHYVGQEVLAGTGEAILLAKDIVKGNKFLVLMGDDFYQKSDLKKMLAYDYAVLAFQTDRADEFGLIEEDKDGFVISILERPHQKNIGLVNTAAYMLSKEYFNYPPVYFSKTEAGLPQTLVSMYPKYKAKIIKTKKWQPVGNPNELKKAEYNLADFS